MDHKKFCSCELENETWLSHVRENPNSISTRLALQVDTQKQRNNDTKRERESENENGGKW